LIRDEFQDLAALWSASAPADEQEEFERLARRTPRLARFTQWGELALVGVVAAILLSAMAFNLGPETLLTGGLLLLLLGWSALKRHHLANLALLVDARDRLSFVRSTLLAKEAELKRSALGLALVPPGFLITLLMGFSLRSPDGRGELMTFLLAVLTTPRGLITLGFVLCAVMMLTLSHFRLQGELARLRGLRADYEDAARRDQFTRA